MPDYEQLLREIYSRYLHPGDVAIDVGAHTGYHTIPMAHCVGSEGRVFAIEPLGDCLKQIQAQAKQLPKGLRDVIQPLNYAIGNADARSEFIHVINAAWFSGLRERTYDCEVKPRVVPIEVRRLDTLFATLPVLAYIKIDTEGGELDVLRGATQLLRRLRPFVSFEFGVGSIWAYEITPADMADFWMAQDYKLFDILGRPLGREAFIESSNAQHVWDYLAIPGEKPHLAARVFPTPADGRAI